MTMDTFVDQCSDKNSFDIYYGSDCYGRGTYGGGLFDVYKALDKIRQYPFSIAIFGQAFTYEKWDSFAELQKFIRNEDLFWHGIERKKIDLLKYTTLEEYMGCWNIKEQGGYGKWEVKQEESGFVAVASHQLNQKAG